MFSGFVESLIPAELKESLTERYQSRILVVFCLVAMGALLPFLPARINIQGFHIYPIILSSVILSLAAGLLVLRVSRSLNLTGSYLSFVCLIGGAAMSLADGGILAPSVLALPLAPLIASFFSSLRFIIVMIILTLLTYGLLAYLTLNEIVVASPLSKELVIYLYAGSAASLTIVLIALAQTFIGWQEAARADLARANHAKDEFLSGMSHELRTPLNSVMGFSDTLLNGYVGEVNDKQKEHLQHILDSSTHLAELVEDLVNLTQIDTNKLKLDLQPVDLSELTEFCVNSLRDSAQEKSIELAYINNPVRDVVKADTTRVRQILLNLISNAIKFSPSNGNVKVELSQADKTVIVEVSDTGPGVDEQYRERIFEKFYQVHSSLGGKSTGSGLGLYISRQLARLHGGNVELVTSSHCTFRLSLPISL